MTSLRRSRRPRRAILSPLISFFPNFSFLMGNYIYGTLPTLFGNILSWLIYIYRNFPLKPRSHDTTRSRTILVACDLSYATLSLRVNGCFLSNENYRTQLLLRAIFWKSCVRSGRCVWMDFCSTFVVRDLVVESSTLLNLLHAIFGQHNNK